MQKVNSNLYIRVQGGLGNQLFQYAFSMYLNQKGFGTPGFYVDYASDSYGRSFLLKKILRRNIQVYENLPRHITHIRCESFDSLVKIIMKYPDQNFLIDGYFQDVRYFDKLSLHDDIILKDSDCVAPEIAIHIRRGDYGHHGILPFSYYMNALESLGRPPFFVYSDEPNYAKYMFSNIDGFKGVFYPNLTDPVAEFLQLASHAGIVIANSSFSWMAAFLAYSKYKSNVIYPSEWSLLGPNPGSCEGWRKVCANLIRP